MPLAMEGPRPLSPLELDAFRLVFWDSIDPCDVYVTVIVDSKEHDASYGGAGAITLNRYTFPHANLHKNSSPADPDILMPANMRCLSSLIHECTHHWQSVHKKYTYRGPSGTAVYDFSKKELETLNFIKEEHPDLKKPDKFEQEYAPFLKEQHASAAQVYFLIKWQLHHLLKEADVNLSYRGLNRVGTVYRYHEIRKLDDDNDGRVIVSRNIAKGLEGHFNRYLHDLRSGGRWGG